MTHLTCNNDECEFYKLDRLFPTYCVKGVPCFIKKDGRHQELKNWLFNRMEIALRKRDESAEWVGKYKAYKSVLEELIAKNIRDNQ